MRFVFPTKFPTLKVHKDDFTWWCMWFNLPIIFCGTESVFCDVNHVWKVDFPTGIKFERNDFWHSFRIAFLGFGFGYARQWDY